MAIKTINENDYIKDSRADINDNFAELDTLKAPLASPALTGTPTAPTPDPGDDSTKIATTEYVQDALSGATPIPISDSEIEDLWEGVDPVDPGGGGGGGYIIKFGRLTTTAQINSGGDAFYDCDFDSPMPDTNYSVFNSIVNNHSGSSNARLMVLDTDKTVNGFKMRIYASGNIASGNEFDWMAIHL